MEITDRVDLGVDLNAPKANEAGQVDDAYSLIDDIDEGDIVFHYHRPQNGISAIVASSTAVGSTWEDQVTWKSHSPRRRASALRGPAFVRPGWRLGLMDFAYLPIKVDLAELRAKRAPIMEIAERLESTFDQPIYFPFAPYGPNDLRAAQRYIAKFPKALLDVLPALQVASTHPPLELAPTYAQAKISMAEVAYQDVDEDVAVSQCDPFTIDPSLVERGVRGHRRTQNALAQYLRAHNVQPLPPGPGQPNFDLGWRIGDHFFAAEVKSLTDANEERQLRLGLGQVLRYRHILSNSYSSATAVLVAEREPKAPGWPELCHTLGVLLCWPDSLASTLDKRLT
jgi:hypothetical protein